MPIIKLGRRRRLVLPAEICDEVNISEGDYLYVFVKKGEIVIKQKALIDRDTATYWKERIENEDGVLEFSEEGRKRLEAALKDEEEGQYKDFDNVEDLIKDLQE